MKKPYTQLFLLIIGLSLIAGCGGGTSGTAADDTEGDSRTVTGSLASAGGAGLMKGLHADDCEADMIIATTTSGETSSADVEEDCSFSLSLSVGRSYVISLALDDDFIATLIFDSGIRGDTTSVLPLSSGGILDLGIITIFGNVATAEHEPLDECDQDGDGEDDLEDEDDDDDGVEDEEEEDCDFDGSLDDYDEDDGECEEGEDENIAYILSVKPYDDPEGWDPVDLEREVKARIDCEVDESTVTSETFYVVSEDGEHMVECNYEFSGSGSKIECDHDDFEDFLPDTYYSATIDGVMCLDGRAVETLSWIWLTEAEDTDEGCREDELDEEDELEEEEEEDDEEEDDEDEDEEDEDEEDDEDDHHDD